MNLLNNMEKLILLTLLVSSIPHESTAIDPVLIIHGGAGSIRSEQGELKKVGMLESIRAGFRVLLDTDNPMDAVEAAVRVMENLPAFNAGYGSVLTENGEIEMDAMIVNGTDLSAGSVGAMKHVLHPISVARFVMNSTSHVMLVGEFAEKFASSCGFELVPTSDLIGNYSLSSETASKNLLSVLIRKARSSYDDVGTVGAVAINSKGNIATATSTGGLKGKMEGRVGDTPIVGAGTLADDEVAGVSGTGVGEAFMRYRLASQVASLIQQGRNASDAILTALNGMSSKIPSADGGAIAITKDGEVGYNWNSEQMAWAYVNKREFIIHYGVNRGEDFTQPFDNNQITFNCTHFRTCFKMLKTILLQMTAKVIQMFG